MNCIWLEVDHQVGIGSGHRGRESGAEEKGPWTLECVLAVREVEGGESAPVPTGSESCLWRCASCATLWKVLTTLSFTLLIY